MIPMFLQDDGCDPDSRTQAGGRVIADWDGAAIVERFRQAAMGMVDWTDALAGIADATGARIGQLAAADPHGRLAFNFLSGCSSDEMAAYFDQRGPDPAANPRTRAVIAATPFRCIVDRDFITPALAARTPIYRRLFHDTDVPFSLQTRIDSSADLRVVLSLQRPRSSGEADADQRRFLDAISPAIGSAVQAAVLLGTTLDQTLAQTAAHLSGAAIVLDHDLGIVALSPAAEELLRAGTHIGQRLGCLVVRCQKGAETLQRAAALMSTRAVAATVPLVLPGPDRAPPLVADLCPLPARSSGQLSRGRMVLAIRQPKTGSGADTPLNAAFGLTRSEAAIAILIAQGHDLRDIADRRGTTAATVRTQLKSVFGKTGCRRQAELALLMRPYC